jgi:hypothetical protein
VEAGPQGSTFVNPATVTARVASSPLGAPKNGNSNRT